MPSVSSYLKNMHDQLDALLFPMLSGDETETDLMQKTVQILPVFESNLRDIYMGGVTIMPIMNKVHKLVEKYIIDLSEEQKDEVREYLLQMFMVIAEGTAKGLKE